MFHILVILWVSHTIVLEGIQEDGGGIVRMVTDSSGGELEVWTWSDKLVRCHPAWNTTSTCYHVTSNHGEIPNQQPLEIDDSITLNRQKL